MKTYEKLYRHFMTITRHKLMVTYLCFKLHLFKQGILHDLSKYSWVEFSAGVKYFQGYRSPIDAEKADKGYSLGWLHHKGRNKHHWEYWTDKNPQGIFCHKIPYNYVLEMCCDRIAACKIYQKDKYTQASAYEYFIKGTDRLYMHPESAQLLHTILLMIKEKGEDQTFSYLRNNKLPY